MRTEVTTIDGNVVAVEQNLTGMHLWVDGVEARPGPGWEFELPIDDKGHAWIYQIAHQGGKDVLVYQGRTYPLGRFHDRTSALVDSGAMVGIALPLGIVFPLVGGGYLVGCLLVTVATVLRHRDEVVEWRPIGWKLLQGVAIGAVLTALGILIFRPTFWWS